MNTKTLAEISGNFESKSMICIYRNITINDLLKRPLDWDLHVLTPYYLKEKVFPNVYDALVFFINHTFKIFNSSMSIDEVKISNHNTYQFNISIKYLGNSEVCHEDMTFFSIKKALSSISRIADLYSMELKERVISLYPNLYKLTKFMRDNFFVLVEDVSKLSLN